MLAACIGVYVTKYRDGIFLAFIAPAVFTMIFLIYNSLLIYFHKKGFYTSRQAEEFYKKCREENICIFQEENLEKAKDVYFAIFGTDKYFGEGTLLAHMEKIYDTGREMMKN